MKEKKITLAIIGLGYWGPNLLRNFVENAECSVRYGCDLRADLLAKYATRYPNVTFIRDYQQILADDEVDAVVIATPPETHFVLVSAALKAEKHVLVEKPMVTDLKEGEELVTLAKRKKRLLMVDHTFVYTGAVKKMKSLIEQRELGNIYYFDSERINLGLFQSDSNVIWDLAPHDISIMNYLFSDLRPRSVFAVGTTHVHKKHEEMAHIMITFDTGAVGHVHVSWISPLKIRRILIGGSKRMIVYDDVEPSEKVKVYDKGVSLDINNITPFRPLYRSGDVFIPKIDQQEALAVEVRHFIRCIQKKERPLVDGTEGLKIVRILEACDRSLREKREIRL